MEFPVLRNWFVLGNTVLGKIYNDPRFVEGTEVQTSAIEVLDEEKGILKTKNTWYVLEQKIKGLNQ